MAGAESAALSSSRMSNEHSAGELRPRKNGAGERNRTVISPWHSRILLLNRTRRSGVPSRTLTGNLALRTRPLSALSYGDRKRNQTPGRSLPPAHTQRLASASRRGWAARSTSRSGVRMTYQAVARRAKAGARRFPLNYARNEWRNAVDSHHTPEGARSLAPRPGPLARLTFEIGRRGEICTPKAVRS